MKATNLSTPAGMKPVHSVAKWQHSHGFANHNSAGEKNTRYVLYLTVITMVAEIVAGTVYGSMALLADGWHMGTHAAAFMITLFAYAYARKHADNPAFTFGTGKVSVLGGYTSAIALGLVALIMLAESAMRFIHPEQIQFNEAILVAVLGLTVNLFSALLLKDHHGHDHGHSHSHTDSHNHSHVHHPMENHDYKHARHDHNLRAAYFHVLADALTSILAIGALLFGKYMGLTWLDPLMGIVGAAIISRWAWGLIQQTSPILLDAGVTPSLPEQIKATIEAVPDHQVVDLHIWRVSADHHALLVSIVSHSPKEVAYFNQLLAQFSELSHITIELHTCRQPECCQEAPL